MKPAMTSIRGRIRLGFYGLAAVVAAFAAVAYLDLRWLERRIGEGDAVAEFREHTLEMRRFEKNLFLYRGRTDLDAALRHATDASRVLQGKRDAFVEALPSTELDALEQSLRHYISLLGRYEPSGASSNLQQEIRVIGHRISETADAITDNERALVAHATQQSGLVLVLSVAVVVVLAGLLGRLLSRSVARPLEELETALRPIGEGRYAALTVRSTDREIVSFVLAFNAMLEELKSRQQQLLRSEKLASLGTLLAGVAHELNNPLSNISTSCQILKEETGGRGSEFEHELLEQIDEQTLRARNIVRSLLDFSRERTLALETMPLRPLVQETVRFLRGQKPAGVEIRVDVPDSVHVCGSRQRLQQALLNLLKNGLEAAGERGVVTVRAQRWRKGETGMRLADATVDYRGVCETAPEVVDIEVHDSGPGIPADILARIFDPFFTTKDVGQGSGLGLTVVHDIVEEHGGCIAVRSAPGTGTSFFIRLPFRGDPSTAGSGAAKGASHG